MMATMYTNTGKIFIVFVSGMTDPCGIGAVCSRCEQEIFKQKTFIFRFLRITCMLKITAFTVLYCVTLQVGNHSLDRCKSLWLISMPND